MIKTFVFPGKEGVKGEGKTKEPERNREKERGGRHRITNRSTDRERDDERKRLKDRKTTGLYFKHITIIIS